MELDPLAQPRPLRVGLLQVTALLLDTPKEREGIDVNYCDQRGEIAKEKLAKEPRPMLHISDFNNNVEWIV